MLKYCIILLFTLFSVDCLSLGTNDPQADMSHVLEISRKMTMREIKNRADSLHASEIKSDREESQLWYAAGIGRPRDNFKEEEWEILAAIYSNYAAHLIYNKDNSVMAFPYLLEALKIEKEYCPDDYALCSAYISMSRIYLNYGNLSKSVEILKRGLERNIHSRYPERANYSFSNMLSQLWGMDALDSISSEIEDWATRPVSDTPVSIFCNLQARAAVAFMAGEYNRAATFLKKSLDNIDVEYPQDNYVTSTYLMLIDTYIRDGELEKALDYINVSADVSDIDNDFYNLIWRNTLIRKYYDLSRDKTRADSMRLVNLMLRDSMYNTYNQTLVSEFEHRHLTAALNENLQISERERQLLESSNRSKNMVILVVSVSAVLIIGLLLWLLRKNRMLQETNNALFRKNLESMSALSAFSSADYVINEAEDKYPEKNIVLKGSNEISDALDNPNVRLKAIYNSIVDFCEKGRDIYEIDFDIDQMSRLTGIRSRDISQAVNTIAGKNFRTFILEQRIREACRMIIEAEKKGEEHMKLDTLAEVVGFRSRPHFSSAFKSVTGMTCTEFLRQARRGVSKEGYE